MTVHKLSLSSATLTHLFILYVLLLVDFEFETIFGHGKAFFLVSVCHFGGFFDLMARQLFPCLRFG